MDDAKKRLSNVQKQILRFLGTGGPSYFSTGHRITRCGSVTGDRRWVNTNATTFWWLVEDDLIVQDVPGNNQPWRANTDNPRVARLLERR